MQTNLLPSISEPFYLSVLQPNSQMVFIISFLYPQSMESIYQWDILILTPRICTLQFKVYYTIAWWPFILHLDMFQFPKSIQVKIEHIVNMNQITLKEINPISDINKSHMWYKSHIYTLNDSNIYGNLFSLIQIM